MHEGQVQVPVLALRRAIANQFPDLADQPVQVVSSAGTVIAPFRVGQELVARLPLVPVTDRAYHDRLHEEGRYARALASVVPVSVSQLVGVGRPFAGYQGAWSVWTWLPGRSLDHILLDASGSVDMAHLAEDLAQLLQSIRQLPWDRSGWSDNGRGGRPLADSEWVRTSIQRSAHLIDRDAATSVWERALAAPAHDGPPVRIHGDPMPGNLLLREGRLSGLIDVSEPVVGDPASDLQPAWNVFDEPHGRRFRQAMGMDEAASQRGRGWAFEMAIGGLHYYEDSNPTIFQLARRTLDALLRSA
ncbi:phosphotransferase [Ornithinimicrobium sediminis]|uniref:phosphotransferase n=1 Tax=Ornithinimicrobium sediminis TaxID=2904603 RepID=UPI001E3AD5A6|nr:phosphotransferase [Ornithinimicrobium sediminis]MCE0485703.1 phosphotransferase [Ornithinimicrobium sediminis]